MPFVNVRIIKGRSEAVKKKIAQGMVRAIAENTDIAPEQIWVVFEDVDTDDWFVADKSVTEIKRGKG